MNASLTTILRRLLYPRNGDDVIAGIDLAKIPTGPSGDAIRAFASVLLEGDPSSGSGSTEFLMQGARRIARELESRYAGDDAFRTAVDETATLFAADQPVGWNRTIRELLWRVFYPEGLGLLDERDRRIAEIRSRRTVVIDHLNPYPIADPAREILFTSNVLVTVPHDAASLDRTDYSPGLKERIRATMEEVQLYYYDHPIHIGVDISGNEAIYGMRGLDDAIRWEKERGTVAEDTKATVVLSLSVTHEGLRTVAREYLEEEFRRGGPFEHLEIYLFTDLECRRIVDEVLTPFLDPGVPEEVAEVFGVDGEYGRHYSFLKAIVAFWQVFVDPGIRGTFKIDLDQVFPQQVLVDESGESALDHFRTPLWGARGRDSDGRSVELGMIAGSLVNEKDIGKGLFTPDVPVPTEIPPGEPAIFYSKLAMAVSTEAEMMTRYGALPGSGDSDRRGPETHGVDGKTSCLQRYHVTGGTNGILVDHLRRHRPFTPTFVGRAEDQAFLLSVLYEEAGGHGYLRYLHKPGLIMRHDKEAFAGASIRAATHGRFIGDLARTWIFTRYAEAFPWPPEQTKGQIDPFTGSFVTPIPYTIIFLRLVIYCAALDGDDAAAVLDLAERKLAPLFGDAEGIAREYRRQRAAWNAFYRALDLAEATAAAGTGEAPEGTGAPLAPPEVAPAARRIAADARIA